MERPINLVELELLAEQYLSIKKAKDAIDKELKSLKEKIVSVCGDNTLLATGNYSIEASRPDLYTWDSEILESLDNENAVVKHTVPKAEFDKLDATEQALLLPALTIKKGTINLKIKQATKEDK